MQGSNPHCPRIKIHTDDEIESALKSQCSTFNPAYTPAAAGNNARCAREAPAHMSKSFLSARTPDYACVPAANTQDQTDNTNCRVYERSLFSP